MAQRLTEEEKAARAQALEEHKKIMAQKKEAREQARKEAEAARTAAREAKELAKAEKAKEREEARKAAKAAREAAKAAKGKQENVPPHLTKVQKVLAELPALEGAVQEAFVNVTAALNSAEMQLLAAHLEQTVNAQCIERSNAVTGLAVGDTVTVTGGRDPRLHGATGKITELRRIRCFVTLPGKDKPVYLFTSEVEPCNAVLVQETPDSPAAEQVEDLEDGATILDIEDETAAA